MEFSEFIYTVILRPRWLRSCANFILRRMVRQECVIAGARIILDRKDPVVSGALTLGVYERTEIAFFLRNFRQGDRFIDVGANVGLYTGLALKLGASSVLAIEPHPRSFDCLRQTVAANPTKASVFMENIAAGKAEGKASLYCHPDNHGDNRLYPDPLLSNMISCRVERLDSLCRRHQVSSCDFLKIDVQGFEGEVLAGAVDLLEASPDCLLMTEFWPYGLERAGSDPLLFLKNLRQAGFSLKALEKKRLRDFEDEELIRATPGRQYATLIGCRGKRTLHPLQ